MTDQFWLANRNRRCYTPPLPAVPVTIEVEMAYNSYFQGLHGAADVLAFALRRNAVAYADVFRERAQRRIAQSRAVSTAGGRLGRSEVKSAGGGGGGGGGGGAVHGGGVMPSVLDRGSGERSGSSSSVDALLLAVEELPCPLGMDPSVWAVLPREVQEEELSALRSRLQAATVRQAAALSGGLSGGGDGEHLGSFTAGTPGSSGISSMQLPFASPGSPGASFDSLGSPSASSNAPGGDGATASGRACGYFTKDATPGGALEGVPEGEAKVEAEGEAKREAGAAQNPLVSPGAFEPSVRSLGGPDETAGDGPSATVVDGFLRGGAQTGAPPGGAPATVQDDAAEDWASIGQGGRGGRGGQRGGQWGGQRGGHAHYEDMVRARCLRRPVRSLTP